MINRRIELKISRTAEFTCLVRALSYLEKREQYKSDDYISLIIMNDVIRPLLYFSFAKNIFIGKYPAGLYEYVIARTKTIDAEFKQALDQGFKQILIFGAGFDSRAVRLGSNKQDIRVFELDAAVTQNAKKERYHQKKFNIPANLIFIPIDFDNESLQERLLEKGFEKGIPTLFILEGLTMYLQPQSVDDTLRIISDFAGTGSRIVFDHIYDSVVRQENLYEGEQALYDNVAANGERLSFGIEKGCSEEFLSKYNFTAEKIMDSEALEDKYFRSTSGELVGRVSKTHCIVTAIKK